MIDSHLAPLVDQWTAQAVASLRHLLRLYRRLGDGKQATRACQAGLPAEERVTRLGLASRVTALQQPFEGLSEEGGEASAWQKLVEAQAGLCALISLVEQEVQAQSLHGAKRTHTKAFHSSILGYRTAFPDPMATEGIEGALDRAASACAEVLARELQEPSSLQESLHDSILEGLTRAAGMELPLSAGKRAAS